MQIINFRFEGGGENPSVDRFVAVSVSDSAFDQLYAEITDSLASYMESVFDKDKQDTPYSDAVKAVMDSCGYRWMYVDNCVRKLRV